MEGGGFEGDLHPRNHIWELERRGGEESSTTHLARPLSILVALGQYLIANSVEGGERTCKRPRAQERVASARVHRKAWC